MIFYNILGTRQSVFPRTTTWHLFVPVFTHTVAHKPAECFYSPWKPDRCDPSEVPPYSTAEWSPYVIEKRKRKEED